jgi:glutathione S-transferase
MKLIGYMDSPYVRRVAVMARFLGVEYEHVELSVFRDFDELRTINPVAKVPTWVCDDGQVLIESGLIIDYLESGSRRDKMMPADEAGYIRALNVIGTAMAMNEKLVQLIYELKHRPVEKQYQGFIDRVQTQLEGALEHLESEAGVEQWIFSRQISRQPSRGASRNSSFRIASRRTATPASPHCRHAQRRCRNSRPVRSVSNDVAGSPYRPDVAAMRLCRDNARRNPEESET